MKRKLIDLPTRWGYYLIGTAAGFGVSAGLLQSPIGMFILQRKGKHIAEDPELV